MSGADEKMRLERHAEELFGARPSGVDLTGRGLEVHFDLGQTPRLERFPGAVLCEGEGPAGADLIPVRWKYVLIPRGVLRDAGRGFSWPQLAVWCALGLACAAQLARVVLHIY
jgi:hypothetical protein